MSKVKILSAVLITLAFGYGLWWVIRLVWLRPANVDHFFTRVFVELSQEDPQYRSLADASFIGTGGSDLTDPRPAQREQMARTAASLLEQLKGYPDEHLDETQRDTRDLLEELLQRRAASAPFAYHEFPLVPFSGVHVALPVFLSYVHPIRNRAEVADYLNRLKALPYVLSQALEATRQQEQRGIRMPAPLLERTLEEIRVFRSFAPDRNPLYLEFARRAARVPQLYPGELNEGEAVNMLIDIEWLLKKEIYPAYGQLEKALGTLLAAAPAEGGASRLPDGAAYYRYCLEAHAGSLAPPDSLQALGRAQLTHYAEEVAREAELLELPYAGDAGSFLAGLSRPDSLDLQDAGLNLLADTRDRIIGAIETLPTSGRLDIREADSFLLGSMPVAYYLPASLSDRRALLLFNPRFLDATHTWRLRSLFFFYGIPGMHLQRQRQQEREEWPVIRRTASLPEVIQGWGLYAARLADELGLYRLDAGFLSSDPLARLGYLQEELLQAAFLVADPALHSGQWTREEAIAFLQKKTGISQAEATLEVDHILAHPGKACAAKLGQFQLLNLRESMKEKKNTDFALQDFHDLILQHSGLPFPVMERKIENLP